MNLFKHIPLRLSARVRLRQDTVYVGSFVVGSLLAFGTLHALRNVALDESKLGLAHDNRHVQAIDSLSPSDTNTSISLASSYGTQDDIENAIRELRRVLPGQHRVQTNNDSLKLYGSSENSYHPTSPHSVIVHIESTEDVIKVVNISRKYRLPLVPYSGATSLEGHFSGVGPCRVSVCLWYLDGIRV